MANSRQETEKMLNHELINDNNLIPRQALEEKFNKSFASTVPN